VHRCQRKEGKEARGHRATHLLVGEDQENGVAELVLREHAVQLLPSLAHTFAIVAVHHKDEA
jgi:hypothetical protein